MDNPIERMLVEQTLESLSPQSYMRELMKLTSGNHSLEAFSSQAQSRELGAILGYGVPDEFKRATRFDGLLEELKKQELKTFLECSTSDQALVEALSSQGQLGEFGASLKRDAFVRGKQEQKHVLRDWPVLRLPDPNLEDDPAPPPRHAKTPARLENTEIVISQNMPKGAGMPTPHYDGLAHVVWHQTKSHFYMRVSLDGLLTLPGSGPTHTTNPDETLKRREQQIQAILEAIDAKGWDRYAIPDGGKAMLRRELCESSPKLFTEASFNHAWKVAKKVKLLEIENADRFRN